MEKKSEKLAELLKQLEDSGYGVKDLGSDPDLESLKQRSNIARDTIEKLSNNTRANFNAWVAWSKSF